MKNGMLFGLLALATLASVGFARPVDYDQFKITGACIRSTVDFGGLYTNIYPQASLDQYEEMAFSDFASRYYVNYVPDDCPKTNGVPLCS